MTCKRYELSGVKSGSYSRPARSYAVNNLTPHYRSADKPFYAMEAARPYNLMRTDKMQYNNSSPAPARTYSAEVMP